MAAIATPEIAIRQADANDVPFLKAMCVLAGFPGLGEDATADVWDDLAQQPDHYWLHRYVDGLPNRRGDYAAIAQVAGTQEPAGAAWYRDYGMRFVVRHELTIGVRPQWQRRGIGALLLRDLCANARDSGVPHLGLHVSHANPRAQRLYEREGFTVYKSYADAGSNAMLADVRNYKAP
jgi:ribosomal protein S18 acetylase RimI-like enzyme